MHEHDTRWDKASAGLTFAEAAALKVFSRLCDEQRPLSAAMVRAELDRILTVAGVGDVRVAVGRTALRERREAALFEWGRSPAYPERAARWARCERAAWLAGLAETGQPLGCGGSPDEFATAHVRALDDWGQTDTRTAGILHQAGVHEIGLGVGVVVPILPCVRVAGCAAGYAGGLSYAASLLLPPVPGRGPA
jgi:hypothetical protein